MLATCICLNGSLLDQLSCTIFYLHNLFTCTFGRINMSVCLSVCLSVLMLFSFQSSWIDIMLLSLSMPWASVSLSTVCLLFRY